ncbi:MAG: cobalamin-binding protein [Tissierellaceae bacterium]|nr:cobalamin-binding protein [Tissierellaceae bacterium]
MKRSTKNILLFLAMMLILVGVVGCTQDNSDNGQNVEEPNQQDEVNNNVETTYRISIKDGFGNIVTLEEAPERIISMAPNNTEILYALGLGDKIVGVTAFCDYPEEALAVEKIGDFMATNFEKIIELEPDLIVNYGELDSDASQIFSGAGIPVISFLPESIDEVIDTIKQIAVATDTVEEGNALVEDMTQKRDEIVAKVKGTETVKVFYEVWHEPLMAAGSGSFVDGLINLVNGDNVAKDAEGEYPNYDIEQLIENDPEIYLTANDLPEKTVESILARPGYENITAIKNGEVYLLDGNTISRPGPRIVDGLELIARALHPEVFE